VVTADPRSQQLTVKTQGTVRPRTESVLVSEVSGRVLSVSPSFAAGGFFEKGEVLVDIDPRDYELALVRARGAVAQARVRLETEEAQAKVARDEWQELGTGENSPLATRELQVEEARASLAAAGASLEQAQRDLARARIRAPFACRLRTKMADVGQFVTPGTPVANIFAIDYVEVRLPIPDEELQYIDLPMNYRGEASRQRGPTVKLYADFAGRHHEWLGRVVRVEGEIDPVSRMVHVIAQVDDPYGRVEGRDPMPLAVGLFVEADILGRQVDDVVVLPRTALRREGNLLVVDDEGRLRFRDIVVIKAGKTEVIIGAGLQPGELVCVSTLDAVTDGMKVRTRPAGAAPKPTDSEQEDPRQVTDGEATVGGGR
jgi:RND family efflux transporter MFP subunit